MAEAKPNPERSAMVPFEVIATWPVGTFLENIAVRDDGSILVTAYSENRVYQVGIDGTMRIVATLAQPVTGIVVRGRDTFVCSGSAGKPPWTVFHLDQAENVNAVVTIPDALLLNGFTPFRGTSALVADSYLGAVFEVDLVKKSFRKWLQHELLGKSTDRKAVPGANGIKCFGDAVFVSNTDSGRIIRIPVNSDGNAENPVIVERDLVGDDFAFDREGTLYIATHSGNSVVKVARAGERTMIAGPLQGMAGSTACAFGRTTGDATSIYVTTTGGVVSPYEGKVQPAKLVKLKVEEEGQPLIFAPIL